MRLIAQEGPSSVRGRWASWLATGMGVGYFPGIPGTAGSLAGFCHFWAFRGLSWPAAALTLDFL